LNENGAVGTEIVLGKDEEPAFEVVDEIDWVVQEVNALGLPLPRGRSRTRA
jgi:hypothetical protein